MNTLYILYWSKQPKHRAIQVRIKRSITKKKKRSITEQQKLYCQNSNSLLSLFPHPHPIKYIWEKNAFHEQLNPGDLNLSRDPPAWEFS